MCKVYYCIVDFFKAFDIVPWHLAYKIKDLCLPPLDMLSLVMALFETIVDKVWMKTSDIEEFWSIIEVKHCYPLSPTFFILYIDELEENISSSLGTSNGCLLFKVSIIILLFCK
jgi:hypothetical protein